MDEILGDCTDQKLEEHDLKGQIKFRDWSKQFWDSYKQYFAGGSRLSKKMVDIKTLFQIW